MQNPFQQAATGNMSDPLGFVKKLWGDMQLPGMVTPTLSVDELDKQIKDLKTVESWLNVNMNMLKGSIHALEVQRATIAALKTMGESFAQASNSMASADSAASAPKESAPDHATWPMHGSFQNKSASVTEPSIEENEEDTEEFDEPEKLNDAHDADIEQDQPATQESAAKASSTEQAPFQHPAAWWTMLQDQFKQALHHAMKDEEQENPPVSTSKAKKSNAQSKSTPKANANTKVNPPAKTRRTVVTKSTPKSDVKMTAKANPKKATAASASKSKATASKAVKTRTN